MNNEINTQLSSFISREILKEPTRIINPHEALLSNGLIDSFRLIDLVLYVEDTFGVQIDETELNTSTFDTLASLVSMIELRLNNTQNTSNKDSV